MNAMQDFPHIPASHDPVIASEDLFGAASVLTIHHNGMAYTLRITRQGKLLLTK